MLAIRKGGHRDLERYYSVIDLDYDKKYQQMSPFAVAGLSLSGSVSVVA